MTKPHFINVPESITQNIKKSNRILENTILEKLNDEFESFYQSSYKKALQRSLSTSEIQELGSNLQKDCYDIITNAIEGYFINLMSDLDDQDAFFYLVESLNTMLENLSKQLSNQQISEIERKNIVNKLNNVKNEILSLEKLLFGKTDHSLLEEETVVVQKDEMIVEEPNKRNMEQPKMYDQKTKDLTNSDKNIEIEPQEFKYKVSEVKSEVKTFLENQPSKSATLEDLHQKLNYSKFSLQSIINKLVKEKVIRIEADHIKLIE